MSASRKRMPMMSLLLLIAVSTLLRSSTSQEPQLILAVQTDKTLYQPGLEATISGIVKDINTTPIEGAAIGIEVRDPNNSTIFLDITFSASNGAYQDAFRLSESSIYGEYKVYATASAKGYPTVANQTTFAVQIVHDISVINITPQKTVVGLGYSMYVNVTVQNFGSSSETFSVTAYANSTAIKTKQTTVASDLLENLQFTWNTTGWAKGRYTISAYALPVPGETNTTNNKCVASLTVRVAMIGDITGPDGWPDAKVDIRDLASMAKIYGVSYPDLRYNPNYDITGPIPGIADGKIDIRDIATAARDFGKIDP
jgi:hypothetical protein